MVMADIRNRSLTLADCRFDWVFHGYDEAFQGYATFSDIDGIVHLNGHFLFVEHKYCDRDSAPPIMSQGQKSVYEALSNVNKTTCLLIAGDTKKSIPYFIEDLKTGMKLDLSKSSDIDARATLKMILADWANHALSN
jgi:hypothetical protein